MMTARECCVDFFNGTSFSLDGTCQNCLGSTDEVGLERMAQFIAVFLCSVWMAE